MLPMPLSIADLPNELMLHVLLFLPPRSLIATSKVSRNWNALSTSQLLWKRFYLVRWKECPADEEANERSVEIAITGWRNRYKSQHVLEQQWG
jgi:hypothetical protein